jgi:hypothetical protein
MGYYENQDLDFVKRTKTIIDQYTNSKIAKKKKFEVTLFLNCCVGLLVVPQQRLFYNLPATITNKREWGISPDEITVILKKIGVNEDKSICNIARHLRNSITHYRFKVYPDQNNEISGIHFTDLLNDKTTTSFDLRVSINDLKTFVAKISDLFIYEIETSLGITHLPLTRGYKILGFKWYIKCSARWQNLIGR